MADQPPSLSSTEARVRSVTLRGTHSITSVVETATAAMEAFVVVRPTMVAALRALPKHPLENLLDMADSLADSEKLTSRQKIQT